jgi:hypothetical protein
LIKEGSKDAAWIVLLTANIGREQLLALVT